jgi:hypothetical protein
MLMLALNFGMAGVPGNDPHPDFDMPGAGVRIKLAHASIAVGLGRRRASMWDFGAKKSRHRISRVRSRGAV